MINIDYIIIKSTIYMFKEKKSMETDVVFKKQYTKREKWIEKLTRNKQQITFDLKS